MATDQENAARDNAARKEARKNEINERVEETKKARDEQTRFNLEKMEKDAKLRPTPTPEEINLAKSGVLVDPKEPDGSPEQNPFHQLASPSAQIEVGRKISEARPVGSEGKYATRSSNPGQPQPTPAPAPKKE
jgi:hypothetical protein